MKIKYIRCACGCGQKRPAFDKQGRLRKYIYHHHWIGRKHNKKSKMKMSLSHKGRKSHRKDVTLKEEYGIERAKEIKEKISKINKGKHHSPRTEFKKGQIPWMKGRYHTEESKKKMSKSQYGKKHNTNTKKYKERNKKISKALKGRKCPWCAGDKSPFKRPEIRAKTIKAITGRKVSKKTKRKLSKINKKLWQDLDFIRKAINGRNLKPTKPEKQLHKLIKKITKDFKYNGNFSQSITIGGKVPDFVNCNGKKQVIELFGKAYHIPHYGYNKNKEIPYHRTYQGTKAHYKKFGFSCLIIWDTELKSPSKVLSKILKFTKEPKP